MTAVDEENLRRARSGASLGSLADNRNSRRSSFSRRLDHLWDYLEFLPPIRRARDIGRRIVQPSIEYNRKQGRRELVMEGTKPRLGTPRYELGIDEFFQLPGGGMKSPPIESSRFAVSHQIGKGETGEVYAAVDRESGIDGAIKVYRPTKRALAKMAERNLTVRKLAAIESRIIVSSHILPAISLDDDAGQVFLWMPRARGTLEQVLEYKKAQGESIDVETALKWSRDLAISIRDYHAHGFTHGDLKSANLMFYAMPGTFSDEDRLTIGDKGNTSFVDEGEWSDDPRDNTGYHGVRAPEMFRRGSHQTTQSDVFAFGADLGLMLTGKLPFEEFMRRSSDPRKAMERLTVEESDRIIKDYVKGLPPYIQKLLTSCLDFYPDARPKDGKELERRVEQTINAFEDSKPENRRRRIGRRIAAIAAIALFGFAGSIPGYYKFMSANKEAEELRQQFSSQVNEKLSTRQARVIEAALNGKSPPASDINEQMDYSQLQGWISKFGRNKTAIAAYLDPQLTYEAVQRADGRTDYESVGSALQTTPEGARFYSRIEEITMSHMPDGWSTNIDVGGKQAEAIWKTAQEVYDSGKRR